MEWHNRSIIADRVWKSRNGNYNRFPRKLLNYEVTYTGDQKQYLAGLIMLRYVPASIGVCLCVCVSVCLSVCLPVCAPIGVGVFSLPAEPSVY